MKTKIGMAIGLGIGRALYEGIRAGFDKIDWTGVFFIALLSFVLLLLVPKSILEKKSEGK
jgi:hypothetical protein